MLNMLSVLWSKRADKNMILNRKIASFAVLFTSPDDSAPDEPAAGPSTSCNCPLAGGACVWLKPSCRLLCFSSVSCPACHQGRCPRCWTLVLGAPGAVTVLCWRLNITSNRNSSVAPHDHKYEKFTYSTSHSSVFLLDW